MEKHKLCRGCFNKIPLLSPRKFCNRCHKQPLNKKKNYSKEIPFGKPIAGLEFYEYMQKYHQDNKYHELGLSRKNKVEELALMYMKHMRGSSEKLINRAINEVISGQTQKVFYPIG